MSPPTPPGTDTGTTDRALLFDMDGVLIEGRGADDVVHEHARDDTLAEYGIDPPERHRAPLGNYEYTDAFVEACRAVGVDPVDFYAARERHSARRIVERLRAGERGLYPDVDALDRVADGRPLGVVSNNYDPAVEFVVDHHGLDAFSFVRGRDPGVDGFRRRKPDPHYLHEALDALDAETGYYVGDRETDVVAAERAGLDGVFVRRDHNADATLRVDPTHEIESLTELDRLFER
ncbi:HAD family hydrolase [Haloplanus rallus]|jgi:HAD superfamily hydrolase (TIGR01549 family)|uniref:HAD family hydrolase n=1 Tax=Haloplanus rallus TaxID=1816183 RepID=A0A6B9FE67_9EURY|nr:HAD-IA family hydrolase [Haloplanus rallus]QGX93543.1 HAD family hydrolase [Haloplanus rallus]